jgi:chromosome partitioning protein
MEKSIPLREVSEILQITPQAFGKIARKTDDTVLRGNKRLLYPQFIRDVFLSRGFQYPKKNIMFHCLKGGSGKSELSRNISYRASQLGCKVLIVDCDKQANTSRAFGVENPDGVLVDIVTNQKKVQETIVVLDTFLHLLPSSIRNARLELELINKEKNPLNFYERIFSPIRDEYDWVVFDMPPDLNHNSYLTSLYCNTICVPTNPSRFSLDGMHMTIESLIGLKEQFQSLEKDIIILLNMFDAREKNSFSLLTELREIKEARVIPVVVRIDTTFKNAHGQRKTVFELPRKSNAKEDIDILTQDLLGVRDFFQLKGNA